MKVVTVDQMVEIERRAAAVGLPSHVLMENAGLAVAKCVKDLLDFVEDAKILILVGPGNNGGDGLVAARHLCDWGADVYLYLPRARTETDLNYRLVQEKYARIIVGGRVRDKAMLSRVLPSADVVIDALFGTGKARPMTGLFQEVLQKVADAKKANSQLKIVAVDLPSGLNADSGAVDNACLSADVTITLACPKQGFFAFPGATKAGRIVVADIGIPSTLTEEVSTEVVAGQDVREMLPERPPDANKGTFGRCMVAAGSINYIGAAYLACSAAARVGAGLVTLATARSLQPLLASRLAEVTYVPLPESEAGVVAASASETLMAELANYDVLLLGCGMGQSRPAAEFVRSLLFPQANLPGLVLDADALNILSQVPRWWEKLTMDAVLTPHPGEMARLTGLSVSELQSRRVETARQAAVAWHKTIVLKGAYTVVAAPDGRVGINPAANPGLASAGTGDVLAGAIAGLRAQGLSPFDASVAGVFLHSLAGEMVRRQLGDAGMMASDLLPALPAAINDLKKGRGLLGRQEVGLCC